MIPNIINLPHRADKLELCRHEISKQGIEFYRLWEGVNDSNLTHQNISQAHKKIVADAKENNLDYCIIMEDDIKFTDAGAYNHWIDKMPNRFDIYFGGLSHGKINNDGYVGENWTGMFCYMVHKNFYNIFLMADESRHIDRWLSDPATETITKILVRNPLYKCINPIIATTYNGYSDQKKEVVNYDKFYKKYELWKSKSGLEITK